VRYPNRVDWHSRQFQDVSSTVFDQLTAHGYNVVAVNPACETVADLSDTATYSRFFGIRRAIPEKELRSVVAQDAPRPAGSDREPALAIKAGTKAFLATSRRVAS
jgi:hypothetical protein